MYRNILITGANRGIGLNLVNALLKKEYNVIAVSKNDENLRHIQNHNLKIIKADLQNMDEVKKVFCILNEEGLTIDILVNNAGIGKFMSIEDFEYDDWNSIINLNLNVPFCFIKQVIPNMKKQNYGRIINIGSDADSKPEKNAAAYCASKYGLLGLTQCVRLEVRGFNIGVTTISPGRVDTYFNSKYPGCRPTSLKPSDVVKQIEFILSMEDRCNIEQIKLNSILE